jgi:hypothetical protein
MKWKRQKAKAKVKARMWRGRVQRVCSRRGGMPVGVGKRVHKQGAGAAVGYGAEVWGGRTERDRRLLRDQEGRGARGLLGAGKRASVTAAVMEMGGPQRTWEAEAVFGQIRVWKQSRERSRVEDGEPLSVMLKERFEAMGAVASEREGWRSVAEDGGGDWGLSTWRLVLQVSRAGMPPEAEREAWLDDVWSEDVEWTTVSRTVARKTQNWVNEEMRRELAGHVRLQEWLRWQELRGEAWALAWTEARDSLTTEDVEMVSKCRLGVLPTEEETGRWIGVPREQRWCQACGLAVGTARHRLDVCPAWEQANVTWSRDVRVVSGREWTLGDVATGWVPGFEELSLGVRARLIRRANGEIARRLREDESRGDDSNGKEEEESEVDDAEEAPQGGGESEGETPDCEDFDDGSDESGLDENEFEGETEEVEAAQAAVRLLIAAERKEIELAEDRAEARVKQARERFARIQGSGDGLPRVKVRRKKRRAWDAAGKRPTVEISREEWGSRLVRVFEAALIERARCGSGRERWRGPGVRDMEQARRSVQAAMVQWAEWASCVPGGECAAASLFATLQSGGSLRSWLLRKGADDWRHSRLEEFGRALQTAREVAVEFGKRRQGPGGEGRPAALLKRHLEWLGSAGGGGGGSAGGLSAGSSQVA